MTASRPRPALPSPPLGCPFEVTNQAEGDAFLRQFEHMDGDVHAVHVAICSAVAPGEPNVPASHGVPLHSGRPTWSAYVPGEHVSHPPPQKHVKLAHSPVPCLLGRPQVGVHDRLKLPSSVTSM